MVHHVRRKKKFSPSEAIALTKEFSERSAFLIQMWANCETWFMRILAILLRIDVRRADLVFSSITSTRSRIDLVRRAGIMCLPHARDVRHLFKLCNQFNTVTTLRNTICHSQYGITAKKLAIDGLLSTNYQRPDFDGTNAQQYRTLDKGFINEIAQSSRLTVSLCGRLERFQKNHAGHILEQPRSQPVPLDKILKSKVRGNRKKAAGKKQRQPLRKSRSQ